MIILISSFLFPNQLFAQIAPNPQANVDFSLIDLIDKGEIEKANELIKAGTDVNVKGKTSGILSTF